MATLVDTTVNGTFVLPNGADADKTDNLGRSYRFNTDTSTLEVRASLGSSYSAAWLNTPDIVRSGLQAFHNANDENSYSGSGTTWSDLSGHDRHATWASTPTFGTETAHGGTNYFVTESNRCDGVASNAYGIDNNSGYTIINTFRQISLRSTAAFKFFGGDIASGGASTSSTTRGIFFHGSWSNENVYFDQGGCCATNQRTNTALTVGYTLNEYNMFAVRCSPSFTNIPFIGPIEITERAIFMNGVHLVNNISSADTIDLHTTNANIANTVEYATSGSNSWNARIVHFMVYNRALSDGEIMHNYQVLKHTFRSPVWDENGN